MQDTTLVATMDCGPGMTFMPPTGHTRARGRLSNQRSPDESRSVRGSECMRRLWRACAGRPGPGRLLRALAGAFAVAAVASLTAATGAAIAGDSGARLLRALPHYAGPALAAGWIATVLAALHLRSLARISTFAGAALRTVLHLCATPMLWLAAMHAGAWFEWQVRRTPIAYGTDWFYAEMYNEYVREPGGLALTLSVAAAVTAPLAAVLVAWIACACLPARKKGGPERGPPVQRQG